MGLFSRFGRKKDIKEELKILNEVCNHLFRDVFEACRLEYGRELVDVMNLKSSMLLSLEESGFAARSARKSGVADGLSHSGDTREKIAISMLKLTNSYMKTMKEYFLSTAAGGSGHDFPQVSSVIQLGDKGYSVKNSLDKAYELIKSLNRHFYLAADMVSTAEFDETLNQAEALCNAIRLQYEDKRGDCDL